MSLTLFRAEQTPDGIFGRLTGHGLCACGCGEMVKRERKEYPQGLYVHGHNRRKWRGACSIDGCARKPIARGWCSTHWLRWRKYGNPTAIKRLPNGQSKSYVQKSVGGRRVQTVHRLVWMAAHGPIPHGYHIHHKNGNKLDNRLENLEMLTASEHCRLHKTRGAR